MRLTVLDNSMHIIAAKRMSIKLFWGSMIFLILILLCSCAAVRRETRFVDSAWPEDEYVVDREYQIKYKPPLNVKITSPCVSELYISIGPLVIIPLPVIPNPFWPFSYYKYKNEPAQIQFAVNKTFQVADNIAIAVIINGKSLKANEAVSVSDHDRDINYTYDTLLTCIELESADITIEITGKDETIRATPRLMHHWRIYVEGM